MDPFIDIEVDSVSPRLLSPDDSIDELTTLLHTAYRSLAGAGLRYTASRQSAEATRTRAGRGECWVLTNGERLIGTITMVPPGRSRGCAFYERQGVATVHQFAVLPEYQGQGIGSRILKPAEIRAREAGATTVALDTAESAFELIAMYERRGYKIVDTADWRPHVNYRSVVLAKSLNSDMRAGLALE